MQQHKKNINSLLACTKVTLQRRKVMQQHKKNINSLLACTKVTLQRKGKKCNSIRKTPTSCELVLR